jgi:hypothetical protein
VRSNGQENKNVGRGRFETTVHRLRGFFAARLVLTEPAMRTVRAGTLLFLAAMSETVVARAQSMAAPAVDGVSPEPHAALELNPASGFMLKLSGNIEVNLTPHHAVLFNGAYQAVPNGPVGEIGYRFYSERRAFSGFFVGPSLLVANYHYKPRYNSPAPAEPQSVLAAGVALDAGYQWVFPSGFVIGIGGGTLYQHADRNYAVEGDDFSNIVEYFTRTGFFPRFLFVVGLTI